MPGVLDVAFAVLFAVIGATAEAAYWDVRFKRQVAAGFPDARRNAYRRAFIAQWVLAVITVILWSHEHRPWRVLGLVPPGGWRLYAGLALAAVMAALVVRQNIAVRRRAPERLEELRPKLVGVEFMLPHSEREFRWFLALSCTAGVCEELLYRGFLMWLVASYLGIASAIVIVSVVFGLAHFYQGWKGVVKTGVAGLVVGGIVLLSGWLIPAMIIHALTNIAGGVVGFTVLGRPAGRAADTARAVRGAA